METINRSNSTIGDEPIDQPPEDRGSSGSDDPIAPSSERRRRERRTPRSQRQGSVDPQQLSYQEIQDDIEEIRRQDALLERQRVLDALERKKAAMAAADRAYRRGVMEDDASYTEDDDDAASSSSKRRRRNVDEYAETNVKAPSKPPEYLGKTVRQHTDFIRECNQIFDLDPKTFRSDFVRITYASKAVKGEAGDAWDRCLRFEDGKSYSWDQFATFLLDLIQSPANRYHSSILKYEEAKQGATQTVQSFVAYMDQLESELEPYTEKLRMQHLLAKVRPELREKVTEYPSPMTDRPELIRLLSQFEENMKAKADKYKPREGLQDRLRPRFNKGLPQRGPPEGRPIAAGLPRGPERPPTTRRPPRDVVCYLCNKKGHYAPECPTRPRESSPKNKGAQ